MNFLNNKLPIVFQKNAKTNAPEPITAAEITTIAITVAILTAVVSLIPVFFGPDKCLFESNDILD